MGVDQKTSALEKPTLVKRGLFPPTGRRGVYSGDVPVGVIAG
jgi:hypothetical protein